MNIVQFSRDISRLDDYIKTAEKDLLRATDCIERAFSAKEYSMALYDYEYCKYVHTLLLDLKKLSREEH